MLLVKEDTHDCSVKIVTVNMKILQCPQKWSHRNQLIHRRLMVKGGIRHR